MNERLKADIKKQYPEMVVDFEFNGEVQFYANQKIAAEMNDEYLKSAFYRGGKLVILDDF